MLTVSLYSVYTLKCSYKSNTFICTMLLRVDIVNNAALQMYRDSGRFIFRSPMRTSEVRAASEKLPEKSWERNREKSQALGTRNPVLFKVAPDTGIFNHYSTQGLKSNARRWKDLFRSLPGYVCSMKVSNGETGVYIWVLRKSKLWHYMN